MNNKISIWRKIEQNGYLQVAYSHPVMLTLEIFLNDGIGFSSYIEFLLDEARQKCAGNLSWLQKTGNMVSIEIDDYVYPDTPVLTTSISNLLKILIEYRELLKADVDKIEIIIDENDNVFVKGGP